MEIRLYERGKGVGKFLYNLGRWEYLNALIIKNVHKSIFCSYLGKVLATPLFLIIDQDTNYIILQINHGTRFSNGKLLDSYDIIWSINRAINRKALRYQVLKQNGFIIEPLNSNKFKITVTKNMLSVIDELSCIAYSIFPKDSLSRRDIVPLNTPNLGDFKIISYQENEVILNKLSDTKSIIDKIQFCLLDKTYKDLLISKSNLIRMTESDYNYLLKDQKASFINTGAIYRYLIPNPFSPSLSKNMICLGQLDKMINKVELVKLIFNYLKVKVNPNHTLFFKNDKDLNCIIKNIKPFNTTIKFNLYSGSLDIISKNLTYILNLYAEENHLDINFSEVQSLKDADYIFMGHGYNKFFPLKSLKFFFLDDLLINLKKLNIKFWANFFSDLDISILLGSENFNNIGKKFLDLNLKSPLMLPLFEDNFGYIHNSSKFFTKFDSLDNIQDWSLIKNEMYANRIN